VSQKGRQKINEQIKLLKDALPECKDVECNKASIQTVAGLLSFLNDGLKVDSYITKC